MNPYVAALKSYIWKHYGHSGMSLCPIIPEKKLAFVAIPKNAGTSIRVAFGVAQGFVNAGDEVVKAHSRPWPGVRSKSKILKLKKRGYLRFCVARNPWERFVSCWKNKHSDESFLRKTDGLFQPGMDFPSFLEAAFSVPDEKANRHYQSQVHFIHHGDELLVDRILRFENLIEDWKEMQAEFDLPGLPHYKHSGASQSWLNCYENYPWAKERVAQRYARDIAFFGYEFPDKRTAGTSADKCQGRTDRFDC